MPDLRYKISRIRRWGRIVGICEALRFELAWSLRRPRGHIRVPGFPQPFVLRRGNSDVSVFETIFVERELDHHLPADPRLIIDGGANVGFSTAFYARRFPRAKVVAVEPAESNCELLRANCAGLPNVEVLQGGLWSTSGFLRIANPQDEAWSFRCEPADPNAAGAFRAYTIQEIIDASGCPRCDLLKLDVEGAEAVLFRQSAEQWLSRVEATLVEVHGTPCLAAILAACPDAEYQHTPCGEKLLLRRRAAALAASSSRAS